MLTKLDLSLDPIDEFASFLTGEAEQVRGYKYGAIAVKNRDQTHIKEKMTRDDCLAAEQEFFHKFGDVVAAKNGTSYLSARLNEVR